MPARKLPYSWGRVKAGDIISFKYKSKSSKSSKVQSVLVLNPRLSVNLKDGTNTKHLIGIKIEESNKITLRLTGRQISLLETIGNFKKIDDNNNLYKLEIDKRFIVNDIKGIKQEAYNKISNSLDIKGQYRTYDYMTVIKSSVYIEPIRIFADED
jgi:hypothetical protein